MNGTLFVLGIVSYGPIDCRNNENRRPDVYTDVRSFARWIRSETSSYDKSRLAADKDLGKHLTGNADVELIPQCGENFCFMSEGGDCTFIRSMYTKCADSISCEKKLVPESDAFVLGGKPPFTASSVGAIGFISRHPGREKRRCTKWLYGKRGSKRWHCRSYKIISRKRRQVELATNNFNYRGLVCPILTCTNRNVIPNEWSTPQHAKDCIYLNNVTGFSLPSEYENTG